MLVERWGIAEFKQSEYSKMSLPLDGIPEIQTDYIWSSLLAGRPWNEYMEQETGYEWESKTLRRISGLTRSLLPQNLLTKAGKALEKTGINRTNRVRESLNYKEMGIRTFLDTYDSRAISVPTYNFDEINQEIGPKMVRFLKGEGENPEPEIRRVYEDRKERFLSSLAGEQRVVMAHFWALDLIQHMYHDDQGKVREWYEEFSKLVNETREKMDKADYLIIVSDHGQIGGEHTPYGFYSCNKRLRIGNPRLIDIKDLIDKILSNDELDPDEFSGPEPESLSTENKLTSDQVANRLKELGYL